jgi:hypothetical protein
MYLHVISYKIVPYNRDLQAAKSELRESLDMAVEDDGKKGIRL